MVLSKHDLDSILHKSRRVTSEEASALIERYIEHRTPQNSRADAVVRDTGVPVWALVGYLPAVEGNLNQVAQDYDLPLDAVIASIYYYSENKGAIDCRIEANYSPTKA